MHDSLGVPPKKTEADDIDRVALLQSLQAASCYMIHVATLCHDGKVRHKKKTKPQLSHIGASPPRVGLPQAMQIALHQFDTQCRSASLIDIMGINELERFLVLLSNL